MFRTFLTTALLVLTAAASAQHSVGSGGSKPAPQSPDTAMPAGKIYIDLGTLPKARIGYDHPRSETTCSGVYDSGVPSCTDKDGGATQVPNRYSGTPSNLDDQNSGSFRVDCGLSHVGFDDPIVWPAQRGRTHLHQFWGNTNTRNLPNVADMGTTGNSTCFGGTLNRSGYWAPVFVYHCESAADIAGTTPGISSACNPARNGEAIVAFQVLFYYKMASGYGSELGGWGSVPGVWPPQGFAMISGNPSNTADLNGSRFNYDCYKNGTTPGVFPAYRFDHIPTTAESNALGGCDEILMHIGFPTCWNGVDLTSPSSPSPHMAWEDFNLGCSGTVEEAAGGATVSGVNYPVNFPTISLNIHMLVASADLDFIRLSSDKPKAEAVTLGGDCTSANNFCAGRSIHSDWVNGWSTANINGWGMSITDAIKKECYRIGWVGSPNPQHSDCHAHLLGSPLVDNNWWKLY